MSLVRIAESQSQIVTVDEMIAHLRLDIDPDIDDAAELAQLNLLDTLAEAAIEHVRHECNSEPGINVQYDLTLPGFPNERMITIPMPPLLSVQSITYIDAQGVERTLDPTVYHVDNAAKPGRVFLKVAPPCTADDPNAVTVRFTAGYKSLFAVPQTIKVAVRMITAALWENREGQAAIDLKANPYVQNLLANFHFYYIAG